MQAPPLPGNAFAHLSGPQAPLVPQAVVAVSAPVPPAAASMSPLPMAPSASSSIPASSPYPATGHVAAPAFPVGLDYPMPSSQPLHQNAEYGPAAQAHVSPSNYNPWAAPQHGGAGVVPSAFGATDTTQGLVLEERPATAARVSKAELALWTLALLLAGSVICHRNGMLRQWFGAPPHSSYALFEAQVLGKPSIETVAGVRAYLSELDSKTLPKTTANREQPRR